MSGHPFALRLRSVVVAIGLILVGAGLAQAQQEPPQQTPAEDARDPDALTPPKLHTFVPAAYPPEAYADKREGAVVLEVEIGADGFVRDARVVEPAGHGFDEAAQSAVLRFSFEPARRGDTPIAARILYRYEFTWKPPAEPSAEQVPSQGDLEIEVRAARDDTPVEAAEVLLTRSEDPSFVLRQQTDAEGRAVLHDLEPGAYEIMLSAEGYDDAVYGEEVVAGEATSLRYRMTVQVAEDGYGAQARVKAPPREMTRHTIEREALMRVAGTGGDALRTLELMPGVARPPFGAGLIIIRGAAPQDSSIQLNGTDVPLLYHFGGLKSFFNSRALERIDFYPGNFSARYGRAIGGIVDVEVRDPATDGFHGVLDSNVPLDSSLLIEGPITDKASFLLAGRRSYLGEVLKAVIPEDTFESFAAPVYYDMQGIVTYKPTSQDRIRWIGYGSGDGLELLFSDLPSDDPAIRSVELNLNFQRVQTEWARDYGGGLTHDIRLSYGRTPNEFKLGPDVSFDLLVHDVRVRGEWKYQIHPNAAVTIGTDTVLGRFRLDYRGPPPIQQEGNPGAMSTPIALLPTLDVSTSQAAYDPGFYIESDLRPFEDWQFVLGLRVDYSSMIDEAWFDPRLVANYQVTEQTKLKAGVGVYSQSPQPQETIKVVGGNPDLEPIRSIHYGLGFEQEFSEVFSIGAEGFFKDIYDNVVGAVGGPELFVNDGVGRIYGMELSGRAKGGERFFGFFSYTLMKSERNDRGEGYRPFDYDQRHIFSASGTYRFESGWELGGTYRVVTGNPITPIETATLSGDYNLYEPVYGPVNSARAPTFHRFDVRVEKKWTFNRWALAAYLDIQNTYNARNPEGESFNDSDFEVRTIRGLPIIPILGVRGEL